MVNCIIYYQPAVMRGLRPHKGLYWFYIRLGVMQVSKVGKVLMRVDRGPYSLGTYIQHGEVRCIYVVVNHNNSFCSGLDELF